MIHGVGVDLVRLDRFERFARDHASKLSDLFDDRERRALRRDVRALAAAWAAKEAALKAIGGLSGWDVDWRELRADRGGVALAGATARHARRLGVRALHLSTSTAPGAVLATVIATR